jgi:hypothetical protein
LRLTPARASAVPEPTIVDVAHPDVPCAASLARSHFFRPLVESLMFLPRKTSIWLAVWLVSPLTTFRLILLAFGLAFVPASLGVSLTSLVAPTWAIAMAVKQSAVSAAAAAIRYFRKDSPPNRTRID